MTKQDYELIAKAIKTVVDRSRHGSGAFEAGRRDGIIALTHELSRSLHDADERFDAGRFHHTCGM